MTDAPPVPDWALLSDTTGLSCAEPMHQLVEAMLQRSGIRFYILSDGEAAGDYDFYLPDFGTILQVDRAHSTSAEEKRRDAPNVIAVQGDKAIRFFAAFLVAQAVRE